MGTSYPGATDTLTNPTSSDTLDSPSHSDQHINANDAIEAMQLYAPRGVLGHVTSTTSQSGITTETDLTGLSLNVTVAASRRIRISGVVRVKTGAADDMGAIRIKEGSTTLHRTDFIMPIISSGQTLTVYYSTIVSPSAGAHTYKVSAQLILGTSVSTSLDSEVKGHLIVEDIGSV